METIDLKESAHLLRGGCGLIIGPAQTIGPAGIEALAATVKSKFDVNLRGASLASIGDGAPGVSESTVLEAVKAVIAASKAAPHLRDIAKVNWSAVLSFSIDSHFEQRAQEEAERKLSRKPITVITDGSMALPSRTVPVFKLLGDHLRPEFVVSSGSYVKQRADWRNFVSMFTQTVRGRPVFCLGMSGLESELVDLAGEFIAGHGNAPAHLIFLADDPLSNNFTLSSLLSKRSKLRTAQASVSDLVRSLSAAETVSPTPPLPLASDDASPFERLSQFGEMVAVVNEQLVPRATASETNLLHDLLFSPTVSRWDPFAFDLDFPRSVTKTLVEAVLTDFDEVTSDAIAVVAQGAAASGKTTILKRTAYELAKADNLVLWQLPSYLPDPQRQLKMLFKELKALPRLKGKCVYYFIDDPLSAGTMTAEAVLAAARQAGQKIVAVVGMRTSDLASVGDIVKSYSRRRDVTIPDDLDGSEWAALPDYLVKLKICTNREEAMSECSKANGRAARDSLSTLYWLLPQTRGSISSSIRDEYFRLGDSGGIRTFLLGTEERSVQLLRDAYEMVAVADHYHAPLPVEVLVAALDVDFGLWIDNTKDSSPAWGIIYPDEAGGNSTYYRTRNSVVTEMIIRTINGGSLSTAGELRVLSKLISACRGAATPVYREFITRVLIPHDKIEGLRYDDGLSLFDQAIEALPFPDKTLKHHKGLWIKNVGKDPVLAEKVLTEALKTPEYPYTDRAEASQHIHTSLAATVLDQIDAGKISPEEGQEKAFEHLAQAKSSDFFNVKAVHVHGNLAARLITMVQRSRPVDVMAVASEAASDIDTSLMVLKNPVSSDRGSHDQINMLEGVREKVFNALAHVSDVEGEASTLWSTYNSQEGFVVAARRLLRQAQEKNRGAAYKKTFEYCQLAIAQIEGDGKKVSIKLREVLLQTLYEWVVVRQIVTGQTTHIDWEHLRQLAADVCSDPIKGRNPLYRFIQAVALAHQNKWTEANEIFTRMRQSGISANILWTPRALLLSESGPRLVQGVIHDGVDKKLLNVPEFATDLHCSKREDWSREGEIAHAYLQFSFAGATAVKTL